MDREPSNLLTEGLCLSSRAILLFMQNIKPRITCHSRCYFTCFFIHATGEPCSNPTFHKNSFLSVFLSAIITYFLCLSEYPIIGSSCILFFFKYLSPLPSQNKFLTFQALETSLLPRVFLNIFTTINFFFIFLFHYGRCPMFFSQSFFFSHLRLTRLYDPREE